MWCIYLPLQYEGFSSSQRLHSIKTTHKLKPHLDSNAPCNRVFLKHKHLNSLLPILTAVLGSVRYCSMCRAKRIQSTDCIYVYLRFILILSYRLFLDRPNNSFVQICQLTNCIHCALTPTRLLFCPSRSPSSVHPNNVCSRTQVVTLSIICPLHLPLTVQLLSAPSIRVRQFHVHRVAVFYEAASSLITVITQRE